MKYEFHAGDYAETKGGVVGYLVSPTEWVPMYFAESNDIFERRHVYGISPRPDLVFARIGQYDFTELAKLQSRQTETPRDHGGVMALWDKINELVDIVNEMKGAKDG